MKKEETRKILQFFGFIIVLIIVLRLISIIFEPERLGLINKVDNREVYYVASLDEEPDVVDLIVTGDSESMTLMSTPKLWKDCGITAFIMGRPGERASESYFHLIDMYKTQKPKVLILESSVIVRDDSIIAGIKQTIEDLGTHFFPIFTFHGLWKSLGETIGKTVHFKGFEIREGIEPYQGGDYMSGSGKHGKVKLTGRVYLKLIKKLCEKNGTKLILVSAPSATNYNYNTHGQLQDLAEKYEISYIDMNTMLDEIGIDWSIHTMDAGDHINYDGTLLVTDYMEGYLEPYELEDHRGDVKYEQWQESYDRFAKDFPKVKEDMRKKCNKEGK